MCANAAFSQPNPVSWTYTAKKVSPGVYDISLAAEVDRPWHIFSQTLPKGGPQPTEISFSKNPLATLIGKPKEAGKPVSEYQEVFKINVKYYNDKVQFVQRVKVKNGVRTNIAGSITYMVCKEDKCLPITTDEFNIKLD